MVPTKNMIDDMHDAGMTIAQIADHFQCSTATIARKKSRIRRGVSRSDEYLEPITAEELERAKRIKIGDPVMVMNRYKMRPGDEMSLGVVEQHKVAGMFPHIVLLDNGMSVDYAEIAMQARRSAG